MKTILASIAAAGVLVAGAFVTTAITDSPAAAQVPDTTVTEDGERVGPLDEVMAGLVADGTLTQAQADEVEARLRAAHEEHRAERLERREERRANRELIKGFLEDGVIDSDELAQLGDDHPFNDPDGPFAEAAADGEITLEELRELKGSLRGNRTAPAEDASLGA